jgi:4-aminobutyrate aminotransferase
MDWPYGAHASTFGGNPVACAAAIETFNMLEEGLLEHVRKLGAYMHKRMESWVKKYKHVGRVQGKGLMIGIGIVHDKKNNAANFEKRNRIIDAAFRHGLLILGCGPAAIRLCPPLVLSKTQADWGMDVLERIIKKLS